MAAAAAVERRAEADVLRRERHLERRVRRDAHPVGRRLGAGERPAAAAVRLVADVADRLGARGERLGRSRSRRARRSSPCPGSGGSRPTRSSLDVGLPVAGHAEERLRGARRLRGEARVRLRRPQRLLRGDVLELLHRDPGGPPPSSPAARTRRWRGEHGLLVLRTTRAGQNAHHACGIETRKLQSGGWGGGMGVLFVIGEWGCGDDGGAVRLREADREGIAHKFLERPGVELGARAAPRCQRPTPSQTPPPTPTRSSSDADVVATLSAALAAGMDEISNTPSRFQPSSCSSSRTRTARAAQRSGAERNRPQSSNSRCCDRSAARAAGAVGAATEAAAAAMARAAAQTTPASNVAAPPLLDCAAGCAGRGTCNRHLGRCDCPPFYGGPDCAAPLFPACATQWGVFKPEVAVCGIHIQPAFPTTCDCLQQCHTLALDARQECVVDPRPGQRWRRRRPTPRRRCRGCRSSPTRRSAADARRRGGERGAEGLCSGAACSRSSCRTSSTRRTARCRTASTCGRRPSAAASPGTRARRARCRWTGTAACTSA